MSSSGETVTISREEYEAQKALISKLENRSMSSWKPSVLHSTSGSVHPLKKATRL